MLAKTHMAFGFLVGLLSLPFLNEGNAIIFLGIVIFFSLVPDIDSPESKLGRKIAPLSVFINIIFGHRGFFHTIYFPIVCFAAAFGFHIWLGFSIIYAIAVLVGLLSHIAIDAMTIEGIDFLSPLLRIKIAGFVPTGSLLEMVVFVILSISCALLSVNYLIF